MGQRLRPHRVLLVREWDQQLGGSGCCGRLNTASVTAVCRSAESPFEHNRPDMERVGAVYRALRERFDPEEVELTVVDPRNSLWLLPTVWQDGRRRGLPVHLVLREMNPATAACALVCDGVVLVTDPSPQEAVTAVEEDVLARPGTLPAPRPHHGATGPGGSRPVPRARTSRRSPSPRS